MILLRIHNITGTSSNRYNYGPKGITNDELVFKCLYKR